MRKVEVGSEVLIRFSDEEQWYKIVSPSEIDLAENKISVNSPLAKAVMGRSEREKINFLNPLGQKISCEILQIRT